MKTQKTIQKIIETIEDIYLHASKLDNEIPDIQVKNLEFDSGSYRGQCKKCFVELNFKTSVDLNDDGLSQIRMSGFHLEKLMKLAQKQKMRLNSIESHTYTSVDYGWIDRQHVSKTNLHTKILFVEE